MPRYLTLPTTVKYLSTARIVNSFNGKKLGQLYYIADGKLWKMMKNGDYREILMQEGPSFKYYFLKNRGAGKSRVNIKRLDEMTWVEPVKE
ncbi:hypothetical protein FACS189472_08670 [Alphaproteobacteria bacterium]|nr:hypothetical protein FACS189472_08670 [Alphaproteobacteria bacterium]